MTTATQARTRYTSVAIILHWTIAALILFNLALGYFMEGFPPAIRGIIVPLHFSCGISVLALTGLRVLWRLVNKPPPYPSDMRPAERYAAHFVHLVLYLAMVFMPLTGWAIVSAHPPPGSAGAIAAAAMRAAATPPAPAVNIPAKDQPSASTAPPRRSGSVKIWGVIPLPLLQPVEQVGATVEGVQPQKKLHSDFVRVHGFGGYILIGLLFFHVLGALKHQFIDRQAEFARMGIGRRPAA